MATDADHLAAVLAAYNATEKVAYTLDSLPDVLPPRHLVVTVVRRFGGVQRLAGVVDGRLYRIVARAVAKTVDGTQQMLEQVYALENQTLTFGAATSTPVAFESADSLAPDQGWYSAGASFTYALI